MEKNNNLGISLFTIGLFTFIAIVLGIRTTYSIKADIKDLKADVEQLTDKVYHITPSYPIWHDSEPFENGEILYPDEAHDDTLVIFNAKGLNKEFAIDSLAPRTDGEIHYVLHMYAMDINTRITEFMKGDTTGVYLMTVEVTK